MKRFLNKKKILSVLVLFGLALCLYGQNEKKTKTKSVQTEPEFDCVKKDYEFRIHMRLFEHKDKVYFCETSLPALIEVVDLNGNPIPFNTNWNGADPNPANNYSAFVNANHFVNGKCMIEVDFHDGVDNQSLCIRGWYSEFNIKDNVSSNYSYDENDIPEWNSYNTPVVQGIPFKFLESTTIEVMQASSKPAKGYYPRDIGVNNGDFIVNPTLLNIQGWIPVGIVILYLSLV